MGSNSNNLVVLSWQIVTSSSANNPLLDIGLSQGAPQHSALGAPHSATTGYPPKVELSDLGFEYIPAGPDRNTRITRAQNARRLGSKLPPAYPNGWFAVVESSELRVGDVKPVEVLGLNLCVYRGDSGAPHVVDAYCPHLGAHLGGGSVSGDCVQCPFHKWSFDATGRCNRVPGQETAPRGVSIKTWETAEVDGAIWIWHDADGNPPKWTIDNAPELQQWGYRGRNEFVVSSHIQVKTILFNFTPSSAE
ncbi:unnamed protein product [Plutella xylostella]|uniref:(diamondback moth) hypothetical protein n=1 Tax=Plutella xylostella TaxID=51655 RepID=A0A8S4EVI1_PLUXY|nr:unnamed protein product [Plutella xylostella]